MKRAGCEPNRCIVGAAAAPTAGDMACGVRAPPTIGDAPPTPTDSSDGLGWRERRLPAAVGLDLSVAWLLPCGGPRIIPPKSGDDVGVAPPPTVEAAAATAAAAAWRGLRAWSAAAAPVARGGGACTPAPGGKATGSDAGGPPTAATDRSECADGSALSPPAEGGRALPPLPPLSSGGSCVRGPCTWSEAAPTESSGGVADSRDPPLPSTGLACCCCCCCCCCCGCSRGRVAAAATLCAYAAACSARSRASAASRAADRKGRRPVSSAKSMTPRHQQSMAVPDEGDPFTIWRRRSYEGGAAQWRPSPKHRRSPLLCVLLERQWRRTSGGR